MELFKNKVGRPSNETLKKRTRVKIIIAVAVVVLLGSFSLLLYRALSASDVSGIPKNVGSNEAAFYIAGKSGGFVYSNKYYAANKSIILGTLKKAASDSNVFFFAADGKTTFKITGKFGKTVAKADGFGYGKFIAQSYDSAGRTLETKTAEVKSTTVTFDLKASTNIHRVRIGFIKSGKEQFNKTILVGVTPTIEHMLVSRAAQNTKGEWLVEKPAEIKMKFKITSTNGHTMYYRWFTYNDYTIKSSNVSSTNQTCVRFNGTTTTAEYPMAVKGPRAGMIRVYATEAACKGDTKAKYPQPSSGGKSVTDRRVLKQKIVKYRTKYTTTNDSGFTVLADYDKMLLGDKIGTQREQICFRFALKYGSYILKNGLYTNEQDSYAAYGASDHYGSASKIYSTIVDNIDQGKPIVIHTWLSSKHPTHYVTVVGYKYGSNNKVDGLEDIWIVDPYARGGNNCYGKKNDNYNCSHAYNSKTKRYDYVGVLWDGKASARTASIKKLHSDGRYLTWDNIKR